MTGRVPQIDAVLAMIAEHSGLTFPEVRRDAAIQAIGEFMTERKLRSDLDLLDQLPALLERLVVHESFFDRDIEQLAFIDEIVLPELAEATTGKLRVWSAACAGGEETYTLAFMLARRGLFERATVLGTDLSEPAITRARVGRYRAWSTRLGPTTPAARYLEVADTQFQVPTRFLEAVQFGRLNLVEDVYPSGQHLILCRNVLIYFDRRSIAIAANKLAEALDPNGWLAVGPSEPRLDEHAPLELVINERGVFYRPQGRARPRPVSWASPMTKPVEPPPPPPLPPPPPPIARPAPIARIAPIAAIAAIAAAEIRRLADTGDVRGAQALLTKAFHARPLDAELHFLQAVLLAESDPRAALAALAKCVYLEPTRVAPQLLAASLWSSRGGRDEARRAYRTALALAERLDPAELLPWVDDSAGSVVAACRRGLEVLDGAR
ncbi:MAG: hypothetical protein H0T89_37120 [Deltaproteobacteria bacterium]|nr:hypothetical protein [Deltaproteobacteria bacterium]MDQ3295230.1 hypothetical protein [Myxococcota bacterium]